MAKILDEDASGSRDPSPSTVAPQKLPRGFVLDKDGKPCRTCSSSASFKSWTSMAKSQTSKNPEAAIQVASPPSFGESDCPADVDALGRSTWTFLHTLSASYPSTAPETTQSMTKQFISLFSELYPCWVCAEDFRDWMREPGNEAQVKGQDEFGMWMCRAHNAVNVKLGKQEFDCQLWKQRWKDGWKDGRCD